MMTNANRRMLFFFVLLFIFWYKSLWGLIR